MKVRRFTRIAVPAGIVLGIFCWVRWDSSGIRAAVRATQASTGTSRASAVPVLVELFTAEGCSSCPPADDLLGVLDRQQPIPNARIIVIGEHVTYWNNGGWRDQFSKEALTERQRDYQYAFKLNDVYTPQMVVNGTVQLNGSDAKGVQAALERAADSNAISLQITSVQVRGKEVTFTLRKGIPATPKDVNVYAALVDPEDTTKVGAGENQGRTLHHVGVVRILDQIGGTWQTQNLGDKPFTFKGDVSGRPNLDGMRLVVFVQTKHTGPVVGADACLITNPAAKPSGGLISVCPGSGS